MQTIWTHIIDHKVHFCPSGTNSKFKKKWKMGSIPSPTVTSLETKVDFKELHDALFIRIWIDTSLKRRKEGSSESEDTLWGSTKWCIKTLAKAFLFSFFLLQVIKVYYLAMKSHHKHSHTTMISWWEWWSCSEYQIHLDSLPHTELSPHNGYFFCLCIKKLVNLRPHETCDCRLSLNQIFVFLISCQSIAIFHYLIYHRLDGW